MQKKKYNIDILNFLHSLSLEVFTVTDVTRHLIEVYTKTFEKKEYAIQFVYRQLKLLEKQGLIKRHTTNCQKSIIFCWSDLSKPITEDHKLRNIESTNYQEIVNKLQKKIFECKAEMFTSVGETEAYSEWISEMPTLAEDIEPYYQCTREQAKLMLGKVKGFERLLAQYQTYL